MDNKIGEGFMYEVFDNKDGTVQKIPRNPRKTSLEKEKSSFDVHKKYLGNSLPETDFINKGNGLFELNQEFIVGKPVDIIDFTNDEVIKVLEMGLNMQEKHKIFFDIFGLEGMIRLFNYYYEGTIFKYFYDKTISTGSLYLEKKHNLEKGVFEKMNLDENNKGKAFISHNMLEDENGNIRFIDTDYRPLNIFHPLNLIGNWMTKKALREVKKTKYILDNYKEKNLD